jgi:hypothetical protein
VPRVALQSLPNDYNLHVAASYETCFRAACNS